MADTNERQCIGAQGEIQAGRNSVDYGRPTHLDLFSGIGGFALAAQWAGFRTIGFCELDKYCQRTLIKNFGAVMADTDEERLRGSRLHEIQRKDLSDAAWSGGSDEALRPSDKYCQKVLAKNFMADTKHVGFSAESESGTTAKSAHNGNRGTGAPTIYSNIFDLNGRDFAGVSLITGGFPCQPFSVAGKRRGAADDCAIWPQMFRVISEARPAWVLGENVPGIIPMELDNVLSDLEGIGYATRAFVIPACAVDARHRRDRVWIVGRNMANTTQQRDSGICNDGDGSQHHESKGESGGDRICPSLPNTGRTGLEGQRNTIGTGTQLDDTGDHCRWLPEPSIRELADGLPDGLVRYSGRVATKVPNRVQKLKGLGNAIVPQVAYEILREIRKLC